MPLLRVAVPSISAAMYLHKAVVTDLKGLSPAATLLLKPTTATQGATADQFAVVGCGGVGDGCCGWACIGYRI
jgi:hypothetical protein